VLAKGEVVPQPVDSQGTQNISYLQQIVTRSEAEADGFGNLGLETLMADIQLLQYQSAMIRSLIANGKMLI